MGDDGRRAGDVHPSGRQGEGHRVGRYTADLNLTGQLHAKFRYADHTHARITRIDATKARALPGVLAVVTHEDVPDVLYGGMVQDRRLFAKEKVRFEGDIVAGVAATTAEIAEQAAALIEVDYEPLPAVRDFDAAMADGRAARPPRVGGRTRRPTSCVRNGNTLGYSTIVKGDADAAMASADVVVKSRFVTDPSQGVPIEPRAIIAQWQGDRVTVWSSTQVPYAARAGVAHVLQIPESHVRVIVPLLGGGFGAKCDFHFEGHVAALARAAGRPVKLVFSRARGVLRGRSPARGHGDRARDRRAQGRHARRPPRPARPRQGRLLRRGRLLRADGGDARARPVRDRDRQRRVVPQLLEQPALVARSAPRPRRRSAGRSSSTWTSSPRRSAWIRSSCAGAR